jgi:hypothetical protein
MWKEAVVNYFKILSQHMHKRAVEITKEHQDSQFTGQDFNWGSPEYVEKVLTPQPLCLMFSL